MRDILSHLGRTKRPCDLTHDSCSLAAIASLDQSWPPSLAGSLEGSTGSGLAGLGPDSRAGSGQDLLGVAVG